MEADEVLDTKGQVCPMPLIKVRKLLGDMEKGKVLEVSGDHRESVTDIVTTVKEMDAEILKLEHEKGSQDWKLFIKR